MNTRTPVNVIDSFNGRKPYFPLYVAARYLAQYSSFFNALQYKILNQWLAVEAPTYNKIYDLPENYDRFDERYDARARLFMRTYSQLKAAADFDGIGMALFLGPQMLLEDPDQFGPKDQATLAQVRKDWASPRGTVSRSDFMRRVRAKLPGYFAQIGMPYHDVASLAAPENRDIGLYIDYTHVTPSGAKVVAHRMFAPTLKLVQDALAKQMSH